jgi:cupin superfamily protein
MQHLGTRRRASDLSFERLIHPVGVETFLRKYWEQQPLVIPRDRADYYSEVLSAADIDSIVGFGQLKYSQLKVARSDDAGANKIFYVDGGSTSDTNQLFHSYDQGNTLVLNFAQCYWEPAARVCSALESFFHFPVGINVYVTPRKSQGFPPHFDEHDAFVLQIEGSKLWRLYDQGAPSREICLNAGDLLYIPRGSVHEAHTTDAASIHVTVGVRSYTWTDLVAELLALESPRNVELQSALPVGFMNSKDALELIAERVPALLRALADRTRSQDGVDRLRERLIERMRPLPEAHLQSLDQIDQISPHTLLVKRQGMLCHVSTQANAAEIAFPGNRMKGPAHIEPALRFIANSSEPFRVRTLPDCLSDASKVVLAKRAVREGLLRIAAQGVSHGTAQEKDLPLRSSAASASVRDGTALEDTGTDGP